MSVVGCEPPTPIFSFDFSLSIFFFFPHWFSSNITSFILLTLYLIFSFLSRLTPKVEATMINFRSFFFSPISQYFKFHESILWLMCHLLLSLNLQKFSSFCFTVECVVFESEHCIISTLEFIMNEWLRMLSIMGNSLWELEKMYILLLFSEAIKKCQQTISWFILPLSLLIFSLLHFPISNKRMLKNLTIMGYFSIHLYFLIGLGLMHLKVSLLNT